MSNAMPGVLPIVVGVIGVCGLGALLLFRARWARIRSRDRGDVVVNPPGDSVARPSVATTLPDCLQNPQPVDVPVAPAPFAYAHSKAALATLRAMLEMVRVRLDDDNYVYEADRRALGWLLDKPAKQLMSAIEGDPGDAVSLGRWLMDLDSSLGPGSWWQKSQPFYRGESPRRPGSADKVVPPPIFCDVYDAAFIEMRERQERRRARKRFRRRVRAEAKRTGLPLSEARARLLRPQMVITSTPSSFAENRPEWLGAERPF